MMQPNQPPSFAKNFCFGITTPKYSPSSYEGETSLQLIDVSAIYVNSYRADNGRFA